MPGQSAMDQRSFNHPSLGKAGIGKRLYEGLIIIERQNHLIANLREQTQVLKTETINRQASVFRLQDELLTAKDHQLRAVQRAVVLSVEEFVKNELKSYTAVVESSLATTTPNAAYSRETLKSV